jgi:tripartite-type tricarboxylate transporter receptor subunit TctC
MDRAINSPEFKVKADEYIIKPDYSNPEEALRRLAEHAAYFEQFKTSFGK